MKDHPTTNRTYQAPQGIVALLFGLAYLAERAAYLPGPVRYAVLLILWRGEKAGYRLVYWILRDNGAPLQWAAPDYVRQDSSPDGARMLGWWFRILAVALRDLPRRALIVGQNKSHWTTLVHALIPAGSPPPVPQSPDTS